MNARSETLAGAEVRTSTLKVVGVYVLVGGLWILFSDRLLSALVTDVDLLTRLQTVKGWFYVAATGLLLYVLVGRAMRSTRQAFGALHESEERNRRLVELSPDAIVLVSEGKIVFTNQAGANLHGARDPAELVGRQAIDFVHPDYREIVKEFERVILQEGRSITLHEEKFLRLDGSEVDVEVTGALFTYKGKQAIQIIARDITERKRMVEALRESEARYRRIVDTAREGIWLIDAEAKTSFVNRRMAEMLGYTVEEMLGRSMFNFMDEEARAEAERNFQRRQQGVEEQHDFRFLRKDGSDFWAIVTTNPIFTETGEFNGALGMITDITDRKHAEEAIKFQAHLLDVVGQSVIATDKEGRIVFWNRYAEKLYGWAAAEAVGRPIVGTIPYEPVSISAGTALEKLFRGERWSGELLVQNRQGRGFPVMFTGSPIHDERGEFEGVVGVSWEIAERKHLEEQLRQSQKMEAVGKLAGGVAHDFNNLLTAITGYSELSLRRLSADDPLRHNIEEIKKASERAASLTRQLLAFSRKQVLEPRVLNLNGVVTDMDKMLRRLIGEDVELVTALGAGLGSVKADPGQVEQVLMNLVVNARDAMPQGGRLTIETKNVYLDEGYASQHVAVQPGPYVVLAVSDTGTGMDAETQEHIFEPFFTTKGQGRGTGLGLSTVYGIVTQSGGHIRVKSEVGHGASFQIFLPRIDEQAGEYTESTDKAELPKGGGTVLLVEDEEVVRRMAREVLEMSRYKVLEAASGGDALLICEQYEGPIHLMITDVVMPQMSGRELAERLGTLRPEMRVLYMSGYTDDAIWRHGASDEGAFFIPKPFTPDALVRKVRDVLNTP